MNERASRIEWTPSSHSERGSVNGIYLFSIGWALRGGGYQLGTTLPISAGAFKEKYPTQTHAKVAAEQVLRAFEKRLTQPAPTQDRGTDEEGS